jgi:hypothetical protein
VSRDSFGGRYLREDLGLIRPALCHRKMEMGLKDDVVGLRIRLWGLTWPGGQFNIWRDK